MPVVGFNSASPDGYAPMLAAFRQGLKQTGGKARLMRCGHQHPRTARQMHFKDLGCHSHTARRPGPNARHHCLLLFRGLGLLPHLAGEAASVVPNDFSTLAFKHTYRLAFPGVEDGDTQAWFGAARQTEHHLIIIASGIAAWALFWFGMIHR